MEESAEQNYRMLEQEKANIKHMVGDIGWFGLAFPAMGSFFSIFAIQLKATPFELGLLSSLPAIFMLLASMISGWWRRRYDDSIRAIRWPAFSMRLRMLLCVCVPFLPEPLRMPALILIVVASSVPQGLTSTLFLVMIREAVTDRRLTDVLGRRLLALNSAIAVSTLALGVWLEEISFPLNYQVMFLAAFSLMMVSWWHVQQIHVLVTTPVSMPGAAGRRGGVWREPDFQRVAAVIGMVFVAGFTTVPINPLRLVEELGATEGFVAIYGFLELLGGALMSTVANRLIRRYSLNVTLSVSMAGTGLASMILAAAPNLYLALPAAIIGGACWTLMDISQFSFFSLNTQPENRASRTRAYYQTVSIATFIGPLIGSGLASGGLSLPMVLLIGAGLRLGAGLLIRLYAAEIPAGIAPAAA